MTMANNPIDSQLDPKPVTMSDHSGGHHWQPTDFKSPLKHGPLQSVRHAVLTEAIEAITGEREDTYGGPEDSFRTIAALWTAYLDQAIETYDVAAMMALLKIARIKHSGGQHRDSWCDLAGYAACGAECSQDKHP